MTLYRSQAHSPLIESKRSQSHSTLIESKRSRLHSPLVAEWTPPLAGAGLLGWYKFDEGSGSVAYNSATMVGKLPDMTVLNGRGDFWTAYSGFGAVNERGTVTPATYAYFDLGTGITFNQYGACHGMFFRLISGLNWKGYFRADSYSMYTTAFGYIGGQYIWSADSNDASAKRDQYNLDGVGGIGNYDLTVSQWYFGFHSSDYGFCVVKANGTIGVYSISGSPVTTTLRAVYAGGGTSYSFGGAFGDLFIYNNVILTRAQWANIYDNRRYRSGMSARSGW